MFESKIISTHNIRQEALDKEYKLQKQLNVVKNIMYINQALAKKNGYFGKDVSKELHPMYGKLHKKASRKLMSHKGKNHPLYGKFHSKQTKKLMSISHINKNSGNNHYSYENPFSETHKRNLSISKTGKIGITNGNENKYIHPHDIIPSGWRRGITWNKLPI